MRLFSLDFDGVWLGGHAVVVAIDKEHAKALILEKFGYLDGVKEEIDEIEEHPLDVPAIVSSWNGDY